MKDCELTGRGESKQCRENGLSAQSRPVKVAVRGLCESQAGRSFRSTVESVQHSEQTGGGDAEQFAQREPVEIAILPQNEAEWSRTIAARTAKIVQNLNRSGLTQFEDNSHIAGSSSVRAVKESVITFNQASG